MSDQPQGNGAPHAPQGNAPPEGAQGDAPKYVTEEQLNRAITARLRSFEDRVGGSVTKSLEDFGSKLTQSFTDQIAAFKPVAPAPERGQSAAPAWTETPEAKAMQKRLADAETALKRADDQRLAAIGASRLQTQRQRLAESVAGAGITADRAIVLYNHVVALGRVHWDEVSDRPAWKTDEGDLIPLEEGARAYLKTSEAKLFLPPTGASGSGDRGGGGNAGAHPAPQRVERGDLGRAIVREFAGLPMLPDE